MPTPEQAAREGIDQLLTAAGWVVCDRAEANITGHRGVAIREFQLKKGHGFADYMLYVDGKAAGVIEAKKAGATLVGVQAQSAKYTTGLPEALPAWRRPLAFAYESTGVETRFTNGLDTTPRSRPVFASHQPDTLANWLADAGAAEIAAAATSKAAETATSEYINRGPTFLTRMQYRPPLVEAGLWPAQGTAIRNLEKSLAENRPRSLIQMATGSGKDFHGHLVHLPAHQVRRRTARAVPRRSRQPRRPNAQRVPAVRLAVQQLQVHRGVHRPATEQQHARHHRARLHLHDPAHVLHAQGPSGAARIRPSARRAAPPSSAKKAR